MKLKPKGHKAVAFIKSNEHELNINATTFEGSFIFNSFSFPLESSGRQVKVIYIYFQQTFHDERKQNMEENIVVQNLDCYQCDGSGTPSDPSTGGFGSGSIRCKKVDDSDSDVQIVGEYVLRWERRSTSTHSGLIEKKRFHCLFPGCGRSYAQKRNLRKHEDVDHFRRILYERPRCSYQSYRRSYAIKHFERKHGTIAELNGMNGDIGCSKFAQVDVGDRRNVAVRCNSCKERFPWNGPLQCHRILKHAGCCLGCTTKIESM